MLFYAISVNNCINLRFSRKMTSCNLDYNASTMKVDLHSHSYYSDGVFSPKEVVDFSDSAGCSLFR